MKLYKYSLDKSSRKYLCPKCGKKKLVRYVNSITGELEGSEFGRCDREVSCGYSLYPKLENVEFSKIERSLTIRRGNSNHIKTQKQVFIPWETLHSTFLGYNECSFFTFLSKKGIPDELLEKVIEMYYLGTIQTGYLSGALSIPFINEEDNIAFVQVKMFNESNNTIKTNALHTLLNRNSGNDWVNEYEKNEQKVTCFFGSHLLKRYPNSPVVLVEAPKTAIYGACYYGVPKSENDFLWLAVYNKSSLTEDKFKILEGRKILLIPDLSIDSVTFNEWKDKALLFARKLNSTNIIVFDFLERCAPADLRNSGGDFADYLAQFSWQDFNAKFIRDKSDKGDPKRKHFAKVSIVEKPNSELIQLFEPYKGYSMKEIIDMLEDNFIYLKLNDSEVIESLIDKSVIKRDYDRDNYYRFDSAPF
ncbi:DUF6371 domain-containing protein [Aquirufa ecclesiirivi]